MAAIEWIAASLALLVVLFNGGLYARRAVVLRRLEARGVVQRRGDPKDGRRALFGLTMRGKKLDTLRTGLVEQAVKRALARLPSDIAASQRMLAALASELDQTSDEQA